MSSEDSLTRSARWGTGLVPSICSPAARSLFAPAQSLALTARDDINYGSVVVNLAAQFMKMGENDRALEILSLERWNSNRSPKQSTHYGSSAVVTYASNRHLLVTAECETVF